MYDVRLMSALALGACAVIYNQLARASNHTLLAMIVMAGIAALMAYYINDQVRANAKATTDREQLLNADGLPSGRRETSFSGSRVLPATFPKKGFKYLKENSVFVDMVMDLRVVKMFDKARYADLLLLLDQLQKTYMYVLAGRYHPVSHIPTFMDIRDSVLESLYGLVFVLPSSFKHVYGIDPEKLMQDTVSRFTVASRTMADVLKSFAEKTAKMPHVPDVVNLPTPNDTFDPMSRLRLP